MNMVIRDLTFSLIEGVKPEEFNVRSQSFGAAHEFEFKSHFNIFITIWSVRKEYKVNYEIEGYYETDLTYAEIVLKDVFKILEYHGYSVKE